MVGIVSELSRRGFVTETTTRLGQTKYLSCGMDLRCLVVYLGFLGETQFQRIKR